MYTLLLNGVFGTLVLVLFGATHLANWGWASFWGILAFIAGQAGVGFLFQRKMKADMAGVTAIMEEAQKRMRQKVQQWQMRPPGSVKQAQLEMEQDQRRAVEQALEASRVLERYYNWVPLINKQLATVRVQLYWSIKDFKQVDALLSQVIYIEPLMIAIRMARMQMTNTELEKIEAFFKKQSAKIRYGQGAIVYALMAWIYVQAKQADAAHKILIEASKKMENATIKQNLEHLANNRINQFSNAGLGDEWYALHLEQPKVKTQRQSPFAQRHF